MSVEKRALEWIFGDDTGLSSKAICAHMLGISIGDRYNRQCHPWDPSDLGRCLRLLEKFPEWKDRMPEMAGLSKEWCNLIAHWDELSIQMENEVGIDWKKARSAPETYRMMKAIIGS